MIDPKLTAIAEQLKQILNENVSKAETHLDMLPENEKKEQLKKLFSDTKQGHVSVQEAVEALKKIV